MRVGLMILVCLALGCPSATPSPPLTGRCTGPTTLDFGEVESRDFGQGLSTLTINNPSSARTIVIEPLDAPFLVEPSGRIDVHARTTIDLSVRFFPRDALLHLSVLRISEPSPAPGTEPCNLEVQLSGLGRGSVLVSPRPLDFGFLDPGQEKAIEVELLNQRQSQVSVRLSMDSQAAPVFSLAGPPTMVIPARGTGTFSVKARPQGLGAAVATLTVDIGFDLELAPLRVIGGIPRAEVLPLELDLPRVGLDHASYPRSFADRAIRLRNVGTSGASGPAALQLVGVELEALDGGSAHELRVTPGTGLVDGLAGGESAEVNVRLEPDSTGPRDYRITILTNDPVQPTHVVALKTVVEVLPPCALHIEPAGALALETSPTNLSVASGTVTFTNLGSATCIIDDLRLSEESDPRYSIVQGHAAQFEVQAGASHAVTISGPRSSTMTSALGALRFHVFNPNGHVEQRPFYVTP